MKIIIIEDEAFSAADLKATILSLRPSYQVISTLSSVREAMNYFAQASDVDLIFSDIHLGDGLSFEIFKSLQIQAPVIFCTAYDHYAIEAFKANGIDYVLKPISPSAIGGALEKFERLKIPGSDTQLLIQKLLSQLQPKENQAVKANLLVRHKDKIIPIKYEEIALFWRHNDETQLHDFKGNKYYISESLEEIEHRELPYYFRANRQFIVNRQCVKDVSHHFTRKLILNLNISFAEEISVSKEKSPQFLDWLQRT